MVSLQPSMNTTRVARLAFFRTNFPILAFSAEILNLKSNNNINVLHSVTQMSILSPIGHLL